MTEYIESAKTLVRRCHLLREQGSVEAVLRSEFQSRLRSVFPDAADDGWINNYSEGTEAHTKIADKEKIASRFIDNLVGSTTIEYEADLRKSAKFKEGYNQVKEHVAGLARIGVPVSQIRGILSDTVKWCAYDAEFAEGKDPSSYGPNDVTLTEIDSLDLNPADEDCASRLVLFIRKHLAREQSRPLRADFIALDLGLHSTSYSSSAKILGDLVGKARASDTSVALATDLWAEFVDHLERDHGDFRLSAYVDEVYATIVARLLSANAMDGIALLSDDQSLVSIVDGSFFRDRYGIVNLVEQDYFGWLVRAEHIDALLPVARDIQLDLYAYDFSWVADEDLFGRLMAQLARKSHRQLLGQEWTPRWLAKAVANRCLDSLPNSESPRLVDMCCGSGSILAEVLNATRLRFPGIDFRDLADSITGFDIDPLAVTLAKTTWVVALAADIKKAIGPITIPVFHADSLFAVTPVSAIVPLPGEGDVINIDLDGRKIVIPVEMVQPEFREVFEKIVDWAYDEALDARAVGNIDLITREAAKTFLQNMLAHIDADADPELFERFADAVYSLTASMAELAISNRNGIWAFILRNTYRPGLLSGQFNGLVSNPPWLAMSALGDNPYRTMLSSRALVYGIKPAGASHLHLELGVTHLLHAVDRYLSTNASVVCLIPGTVFNGNHYEQFRRAAFLKSTRPVALEIEEIWQVVPGTFKYPGACVIGRKRSACSEVSAPALTGGVVSEDGIESAELTVLKLGDKKTAWVLNYDGSPVGLAADGELPLQGADLMPRSAVCVELIGADGFEQRVTTPKKGSPFGFAVKDSKQLKGVTFDGFVAPQFIYRMAQSINLLPFTFGKQFPSVAIPAERNSMGRFRTVDTSEIRSAGYVETARRFQRINDQLAELGQGKRLQDRVNERNKLSLQDFCAGKWLILSGAGGKDVCAACLPIAGNEDLLIDQTLYWRTVPEEEAWYQVGMLNSKAMTEAIRPFNPKGEFGERHIHTLPYRVLPPFDGENEAHNKIGSVARKLTDEARTILNTTPEVADANKAIHARRRRLRLKIENSVNYLKLEEICATVLGTAAKTT